MQDKLARNIISILLLALFMKYNIVIDLVLFTAIAIIIIKMDLDSLLKLFVVLVPWDLVISISGIGSIFRVIQVLIIMKVILLKKNKILTLDIPSLCIFLLISLYSIFELIIYRSLYGVFIVLNISILLMIKKEDKEFKNDIFKFFTISIFFTVIYGIIHNNFGRDWIGSESILRFFATTEPNFAAMFFNMGIVIILMKKKLFEKYKFFFIVLFLYFGLFMTVSTSGILINITILVFMLIVKLFKNKIYIKIKIILSIFIVLFVLFFSYDYIPPLQNVTERVVVKFKQFSQGNLSDATTGRSDLTNLYMNEIEKQPKELQWFGNMHFHARTKYGLEQFSHNTLVDIKSTFGTTGLIFIISNMIWRFFLTKDFTVKLLMLVTYASLLGLSSFTNRAFFMWLFF